MEGGIKLTREKECASEGTIDLNGPSRIWAWWELHGSVFLCVDSADRALDRPHLAVIA